MLAPEPKSINWADVCRDGGSYALVYCDGMGAEHILELPVILSRQGQFSRIGYSTPTIRDYHTDCQGEPIALSWQEAAILAKQLSPLVVESISGAERAAECIQLLTLGGRLP